MPSKCQKQHDILEVLDPTPVDHHMNGIPSRGKRPLPGRVLAGDCAFPFNPGHHDYWTDSVTTDHYDVTLKRAWCELITSEYINYS